jgi:VWFA-related protein
MGRLVYLAILVLAFEAPFPAVSQAGQNKSQNQDQTVRISAELVQMDVLVTDKNGKPVPGLKREDFQLFDNNKLQRISHFSFEEIKPLRVAEGATEFRSLPKALTSSELKRVIAFIVDTIHMKPDSVYRTQKMAIDFIETKMEPGDLVLILPTTGGTGLYQQFTSDRRILARAAGDLRPFVFFTGTTPHRSSDEIVRTQARNGSLSNPLAGPDQTVLAAGASRQIGSRADPEEEADVRVSLSTLSNLTRYMGRLPGRKLALFVSEGMRLFQTRMEGEMRDTIDQAQRSNVVFYTIDPRGLDTQSIGAGDEIIGLSSTSFLNAKRDDYIDSQDALSALAIDTGGKFFHDNNDIKRGLESMLEENSAYYMLGFQPEQSGWDGKVHKIKVSVPGRPDLRVSSRRSYLARAEATPKPRTAAESHWAAETEAITSPLVRRDIDLQLTPFYRDDKKGKPFFMALLHIGVSKLKLVEIDGRRKDKLELVGFVLDAKGKIIDIFGQDIELNMPKEAYEKALKDGFLAVRTLAVKPGAYQIRVLVRERETGSIGTAQNYLEVPDLKGKNLAISSIVTDVEASQTGTGQVDSESTLSQRRFHRGSQFNYTVAVYNAKQDSHGSEPQLAIRTRILAGAKEVYRSEPRTVKLMEGSTPPSRVIAGGTIGLGKLPPGDYTLEVTIVDRLVKKDGKAVVRQELDFAIE